MLHGSATARRRVLIGLIKINSARCVNATIDVDQHASDPRNCNLWTTRIMGGPGLGMRAEAGRALWRGKVGRATEPPCEVPASRPIRVTITPARLAVSASLRWRKRRSCDHECQLHRAFDKPPRLTVRYSASASHSSHLVGVARVALLSQRHRPELPAIGAGVLRHLVRALTHTSSHPFAYWLIRPRAGCSHRCVRTPHPAD